MGYYSSLNIENIRDDGVDYKKLSRLSKRLLNFNIFAEEYKAYDLEGELSTITEDEEMKDILLIVVRTGEESGDIEKYYAKNGKVWSTEAKIVFEDFKEEYLK
jgi:hypothetical protein